ncbi:MAG TPA: trypco2 family protein [Vicinamibacterales bacterium]|nr:trypco2 family protein [Vicinamibacterales bacterium]
MSELALADAIDHLRRELGRAIDAGSGERLQFGLGPVELELQVALSATGGAKAEAKWIVLSLGANAGAERAHTHTVKLTLTPQFDGQRDILVGDRRPVRD